MPAFFATLFFLLWLKVSLEKFSCLNRTDDANFVVITTTLTTSVRNRVDMQFGRTWFIRKLSEALCQLFLKFIVKCVLGTKEDDSTL